MAIISTQTPFPFLTYLPIILARCALTKTRPLLSLLYRSLLYFTVAIGF